MGSHGVSSVWVIFPSSLVCGLTERSGVGGVILTVGLEEDSSCKWPLCLFVLSEG